MGNSNSAANLIIVGGGLSGLLTAWLRLSSNPGEAVEVIEAAAQVAGSHTWSFNLSDLSARTLTLLQPFIAHRWPRYEVRFPGFQRTLQIAYASGDSESLREAISPLIEAGRLVVNAEAQVSEVYPTHVVLQNGQTRSASAVIDARGGTPGRHCVLAYQKFVGQVVRTRTAHGLLHPILMDANVDQLDGYRFVYCLPFSPTRLLIEDTYYSEADALDERACTDRIATYAAVQNWQIEEVIRIERGVLPIALAGDVEANLAEEADRAPRIGLAGGLFHATTGYSLPDAVRVAEAIALLPELTPSSLRQTIASYRRQHWHRQAFYRRLNRMMFCAAEPAERYRLLQRFYTFDEGLIERFYAGSPSRLDRARMLIGRPPVPISAALRVLREDSFYQSRTKGKHAVAH